MNTADSPAMAGAPDHEKTIREMIRHENDLMNHRITWLTTTQGLLFTALGFTWGKPGANPIIYMLCLVGIAVPLSTYWVLHGAQMAVKELKKKWDSLAPEGYRGPDVVGYWHPKKIVGFITPWLVFPCLFLVAWITILTASIANAQIPAASPPAAPAVASPAPGVAVTAPGATISAPGVTAIAPVMNVIAGTQKPAVNEGSNTGKEAIYKPDTTAAKVVDFMVLAAGVVAAVTVVLLAIGKPCKKAIGFCLAVWLLVPPIWFFVEFFWLFRNAASPGTFEAFKYGQDLSSKIWAGMVALITARLVQLSEAEKKEKGEAQPIAAALEKIAAQIK